MYFRTEIDKDYISVFEKIILTGWHKEYENILDIEEGFKEMYSNFEKNKL